MTKRPSLAGLGLSAHVATKGEPAAKKRAPNTKAPPVAGTRHMQLRLNDAGWEALKMLSITERRPLQALMIEAANDLLKKYRKAAVVEGPSED